MLLLASRQLDTITSGNSDCWGTEGQQRPPLGCSGSPRGGSRGCPPTALLLKSSYLAKFLRNTKRLSAPGAQELCTSTTDSWSSRQRSGGTGGQQGRGSPGLCPTASPRPLTQGQVLVQLHQGPAVVVQGPCPAHQGLAELPRRGPR